MSNIEKLLALLPNTYKKTVLIVERDRIMSSQLIDLFQKQNYQIFIESHVDAAKKRLQVLDHTKTRVDLAVIRTKDVEESNQFTKLLMIKYPDIKTVIFDNPKILKSVDSESVLLNKDNFLEVMTKELCNSIDMSRPALKKHISEIHIKHKEADEYAKKFKKRQLAPLSIADKILYAERKRLVCKHFAKLFLECFKETNLNYRRYLWVELKRQMEYHKTPISFKKVRKLLVYWHTSRYDITLNKTMGSGAFEGEEDFDKWFEKKVA